MANRTKITNSGFIAIEAFVAVIILVLIIGAGIFVFKKHKNNSLANTASPLATIPATTDVAKVGTTSGVDANSSQEATDEASINTKHASAEQTTAASTKSAATDIGGAYNESNL